MPFGFFNRRKILSAAKFVKVIATIWLGLICRSSINHLIRSVKQCVFPAAAAQRTIEYGLVV